MLAVREIYCPAHFGNTFEVAGRQEMTDFLTGARDWGCNRFSDWFDAIDLYDPYDPACNPRKLYNFPEAIWRQKFATYESAAALGYELALDITPNHVYTNQLHLARPAVQGADPANGTHVFGQLLCPADDTARAIILRNQENLFCEFRNRGLALKALSLAPYDYGGCLCEQCRPWIVTFGKLCRDIAALAETFFPGIETNLVGWWWSETDHRGFTRWANAETPNRFHAMAYHLPYDATRFDAAAKPVPGNCRERAFVHACYGDQVQVPGLGRHVYGHFGVPVAPTRITETVRFLEARQAEGWMAYCEGAYVDLNVALLAGLSSGQATSAQEVLEEYARRHFGSRQPKRWAELILALGHPETLDAATARAEFDRLARRSRESWRLRQLDATLCLFAAHQEVMRQPDWTADRLAAADRFWLAKEELYRGVWGLGVPRHIFQMDACPPVWNAEYRTARGRAAADVNALREQ